MYAYENVHMAASPRINVLSRAFDAMASFTDVVITEQGAARTPS